jgi:hypothetical protein
MNSDLVRIAFLIFLVLAGAAAVVFVMVLLQVRRFLRTSVPDLLGEITATLRQARATLEQVQRTANGVDTMVREQISPSVDTARATIAKAHESVHSFTDGMSNVQRVAKVMQAAAGAGAVGGLSAKVLRGRGGRIGLMALAAGAVVQALLKRNRGSGKSGHDNDPLDRSDVTPEGLPRSKRKDGRSVKTNGR